MRLFGHDVRFGRCCVEGREWCCTDVLIRVLTKIKREIKDQMMEIAEQCMQAVLFTYVLWCQKQNDM